MRGWGQCDGWTVGRVLAGGHHKVRRSNATHPKALLSALGKQVVAEIITDIAGGTHRQTRKEDNA